MAVPLTVALRAVAVPWIGTDAPYLMVLPVVVVIALVAGVGPGVVAAIGGSLAMEPSIGPATGALAPAAAKVIRVAITVASAVVVARVGERLRAADASLRSKNRVLRAAYSARSAFVTGLQEANAELARSRERARESEAILRESEERIRTITEAMPQIVCTLRPDGSPEYVNAQWKAFSGLDVAATAAVGWAGVLHPDDLVAAQACRRRVLASGEPHEVELRYRAIDGRFRWFLSRLAPIGDGTGRVVRLVGAAMDITAHKEAQQALVEADRRKTEFLGMLSHELRNPLAPIRSSIYILEHAAPASEDARRARAVIARQSEHLTRLVDDLLDVTRIARGKIELRPTRVDLGDVLRRTAEDLRAVVEQRGIELALELPSANATVVGDATRLGQVIGNLLHNATKFTPPGGRVTLALTLAPDTAEIRVRDTGSGIDRALLDRVFEPFVQGEESLARTQGGLGLGLALVKGVTELHGGSVRAESAGPGAGAEFVVQLPLAGPSGPEPAVRGAPAPSQGGRRVLVVDDNADAAESLAQLVALFGHTVEVAYDGASAIAKAHSWHPGVVLCDIGLPGLSGYDVARALREEIGGAVQLVALTGYAQPDDVKRAADAGFDAHVAKPADPAALERLLATPRG
jgi:PAS domain S-box-containing protein